MIIKNGFVFDGINPGEKKDIIIKNNKIIDIGHFNNYNGKIIDAAGYTVSPSFIDAHRHCDTAVFKETFGDLEIRQGITSILCGNCGLSSVFPHNSKYKKEIEDYLEPCVGKEAIDVNLYDEYINLLEKSKIATNINAFVGIGTTMASIRGYGKNEITKLEIDKAINFLESSLDAGACGISAGIMYQPECYMTKENYIDILKPLRKFNRPLVAHIRGEGDNLIPSLLEVIEITEKAGIPLVISHFKSTGINNWNKGIYDAIYLIDKRRSVQDITVDFYPYNGGSTTILSLIPPNCMKNSIRETIGYLSSYTGKENFKKSLSKKYVNWENIVKSIGWERIVISSVNLAENELYVGKNLVDALNISEFSDINDFVCNLICVEGGKVGIIVLSMYKNDIVEVAKLSYSTLISDSLYNESKNPHPRLNGSFATFLDEFVNNNGISMESAISKITSKVASRYNLKNVGKIQKNYDANINIFKNIGNAATFEKPCEQTTGFKNVILNGEIVSENDKIINKICGKYMKVY